MKRNKSGFTLIELLAVIVILAIIALIAVPVVMNIITKSRKSAFKDSAYGIIKAGELYYADRLLEPEGMTEDKTFTFPNEVAGLDLKGSKPSSGSVIVTKEGKVAIGVTDGKYCITKGFEDADVTVTEDVENCEFPKLPIMTSENSCIQAGNTCSADDIKAGITVNVKVNDEQTEKFYVLADDGNKVTLILNRNLGNNVAWYADASDNSYGPITALTALQDRTSTWTNLPEMTINTFDYDDGREDVSLGDNKSFTMYVRLPKYSEISAVKTANGGTMPKWLHINLWGTGDDTKDSNGYYKYGYWTSTVASSYSYIAHVVSYSGGLTVSFSVDSDRDFGVRPVIELSK